MRTLTRVVLAAAWLAGAAPVASARGESAPAESLRSPPRFPSAGQDRWLAADKELHFAGSLAIAASLRVEGQRRGTAVAATFGVGLLKEAYDAAIKPRRMGRGASWRDL